jgi:hypothetical protein
VSRIKVLPGTFSIQNAYLVQEGRYVGNYCGKSVQEDANVYIQNPDRQTEAAS